MLTQYSFLWWLLEQMGRAEREARREQSSSLARRTLRTETQRVKGATAGPAEGGGSAQGSAYNPENPRHVSAHIINASSLGDSSLQS